MRVKKSKDGVITYTVSGDLQKEVDKVYKELKSKKENLFILEKIYNKAKKEYESCLSRIENIEGFLWIG